MRSGIRLSLTGIRALLFITMTAMITSVHAAAPLPESAQLPPQTGWPNPLVSFNGVPVTSQTDWINKRRPELKELFEHYMYGKTPPAPGRTVSNVEREDSQFFGGKATLKEVTIAFGPVAAPRIHLLLVTPNHQRRKRVPVFVGVNFCG